MKHVARERSEAGLVGNNLARKGNAHHGAAMKCATEGHYAGPACGGASDLDGVLHRFHSGSKEGRLLGTGTRREAIDSLCQFDVGVVRNNLISGMRKLVQLLAHGGHDPGMAMPRVVDRDARGKVDVSTAVQVP